MATATKNRSAKSPKSRASVRRYVGKPAGVIQHRVEEAGPSHFGIVSVDCAKRRSKWMLLDFYGRVLVEPTDVEHNAGSLTAMTAQIKEAFAKFEIRDPIAAVEMTGVYHKRVQAALRKAGLDTRTVHPFASKHYRRALHPDKKTDDNDLEAIFHAAINGYGLATLPVDAISLDRVVAWAHTAAEPTGLAAMLTDHWSGLLQVWELLTEQINRTEREMAGFLVKTPYVLLLSVTGINVVSAAGLAGEAGPIEHYASARAINGRAGLYPWRYQSDMVDHQGGLTRSCNRRLRNAAMMVAKNLIKCHPYYRGLSSFWEKQKVDPRDRHCRIANRAMRMVFQLVSGRQVWSGKSVDREAILSKLREFHRDHHSDLDRMFADLHNAFAWLPKSTYASEAKPLQELAAKKRRGSQRIGDLLVDLLIRFGVKAEKSLESEPSEALKS